MIRTATTMPTGTPVSLQSTNTYVKNNHLPSLEMEKSKSEKIEPVHYISSEYPFAFKDTWIEYNVSMESVYGIALIGHCIAPSEDFNQPCKKSFKIFWSIFNQCYLLLILNYIAQFTCIFYISEFVVKAGGVPLMSIGNAEIDENLASTTCQVEGVLRLVSLCLFLSAVLGDVAETISIFQWVCISRTETKHKQIEISVTESGDKHLTSGFTVNHKVCQIISVVLPKFVIGILVMMYGSAFIVLSGSNEDAFLNTLAAVFVVEIDELLHKAYVSRVVKDALANLPPIRTHLMPKVVLFDLTLSNLVLFFIVVLVAFWTSDKYCRERDIEIEIETLSRKNLTL